ncbi:hypothetical protein M569_07216, partial [Genlisea aurea]
SIETALRVADAKKDELKRAFDELRSRSHLLASFNFKWDDIDSHFSSMHSVLVAQLSSLRAAAEESVQPQKPPKTDKRKGALSMKLAVPARAELKTLCENMDGLGLRKYVMERPMERIAIRVELADAFRSSPNPGSIVLDALDGFWDDIGSESRTKSNAVCVVLLEELMRSGADITSESKDRASAIAAGWKTKIGSIDAAGDGHDEDEDGKEEVVNMEGGLERLAYLQLLATYKLISDDGVHDSDELVDCVVWSSKYRQIFGLCRALGLDSKISDVIVRLISKGEQLVALKFIFEFELTDRFPPVPLLKAYVMDCQKLPQKVVRKNTKSSSHHPSLNEAAATRREISRLKLVIRFIEDHDLEPLNLKDEVLARIDELEKGKPGKRPAPSPSTTKPLHHHQLKKKPKSNGSNNKQKKKFGYKPKPPAAAAQQSRVVRLTDQGAPRTAASSYLHAASPGGVNLAAPYGGYGNPYEAQAHVYYDRGGGGGGGYNNGGYDVQYHHQVYYPQ